MATSRPVLLEACLNGTRGPGEHPLPRPLLEPGARGSVPGDHAVPGMSLWSQADDQLEVEP